MSNSFVQSQKDHDGIRFLLQEKATLFLSAFILVLALILLLTSKSLCRSPLVSKD